MNLPDKLKAKWTAPCIFHALAESTKEEVACILYQRTVPPDTCGRDCQGYRAWKGNA